MSRLPSLEKVVERARVHGIEAEHLQTKQPTVSLRPCPNCRDGYAALAEWDGLAVTWKCNGCEDGPAITAALLAEPGTANAPALRLYTPAELLEFPEPMWLLEPFIVDGGFSVLFGASGTFKSFVALDWAARAPGLAVYVSAEGSPRKFGERIRGWEVAAGRGGELRCIPHAINLLDSKGDLASLCAALDGLDARLLVIDTAARNMAGGDENSTRDMGMLVAAVDELRRRFGCAVLVLHHTGHENTDRERGSSALRGAADFSIRAKRGDGLQVRLECAKVRDFEEFEPVIIRLEPIEETLVACQPVTLAESLDDAVRRYLADHPDASQNAVEEAVPGRAADIRAAYKRVRPVRPEAGRTRGQGASRVVPLKGTRAQSQLLDPTLDPDEHKRAQQDGGW